MSSCLICLKPKTNRLCENCLSRENKQELIEDILSALKGEYLLDKSPFFGDRDSLQDWVVDKSGKTWSSLKRIGLTLPKIESKLGIDMVKNRAEQAKNSYDKSNQQEWRIHEKLRELSVFNLQWDGRISGEHKRRLDFTFYLKNGEWWGVDCFHHETEKTIKAEIHKKIKRGYQDSVNKLFLIIPDHQTILDVKLPSNVYLMNESNFIEVVRKHCS